MPPSPPWVSDPVGPVAGEIVPLYWIMFGAAVLVLAIVDGALIYSGVTFRERPGRSAAQFHSHTALEVAWTVIPTIMVITFSVLSFQRLLVLNDTDTGAEMTIGAEGRQWTWNFSYPDQPLFRTTEGPLTGSEELHIPASTKIKVELSSKDVIHSFWVPKVGGKKDAVPGRATSLWIQADRPGTYKGQCLEFCGDGHADMLITLVVHPKAEYANWAKQAVAETNLRFSPETKEGRELFTSLACAGCHTIRGLTAGKVGPELTHIMSKKPSTIAGVLSPLNEENLKKWLSDPPGVKPGTSMPKLGLDGATIDKIVAFLLTQK